MSMLLVTRLRVNVLFAYIAFVWREPPPSREFEPTESVKHILRSGGQGPMVRNRHADTRIEHAIVSVFDIQNPQHGNHVSMANKTARSMRLSPAHVCYGCSPQYRMNATERTVTASTITEKAAKAAVPTEVVFERKHHRNKGSSLPSVTCSVSRAYAL